MGKDNISYVDDTITVTELEKEFRESLDLFAELTCRIEARLEQMKVREDNWNELQRKVAVTSRKEGVVCLNVGMHSLYY